MKVLILNIFSLILFLNFQRGDAHTATHKLEGFVKGQNDVVGALEESIKYTEEAVRFMKQKLDHFKKHNEKAQEDIDSYIGNPLYMVTLLKRLSIDLNKIVDKQKLVAERNLARLQMRIPYATVDNFEEAVLGLVKIMEFYDQSIDNASNNTIGGKSFDIPITDEDCFYISRILNKTEFYEYSIEWMKHALNKRSQGSEIKLEDMLKVIADAFYQIGDYANSLVWYDKLVKLNISDLDTVTKRNKVFEIVEANKKNGIAQNIKSSKYVFKASQTLEELSYFHAICRRDLDLSPKIIKRLHCFYKHGKDPFLTIAPIKTEEVYLEPNIYTYHDVISDNEIAELRNISLGLIRRLENTPPETNVPQVSDPWLKLDAYNETLVKKIHRRAQDITDLSTADPEPIQIVNYGLGGTNRPHYDFLNYLEKVDGKFPRVDRLATLMFYLTDVEAGGRTAFLRLGTSVPPKKGSALLWRNLHPSTQADTDSEHAACPVLLGKKHIALAGQQMVGNEFFDPCTVEFQPEGGRDLISPISVNKKSNMYRKLT